MVLIFILHDGLKASHNAWSIVTFPNWCLPNNLSPVRGKAWGRGRDWMINALCWGHPGANSAHAMRVCVCGSTQGPQATFSCIFTEDFCWGKWEKIQAFCVPRLPGTQQNPESQMLRTGEVMTDILLLMASSTHSYSISVRVLLLGLAHGLPS